MNLFQIFFYYQMNPEK